MPISGTTRGGVDWEMGNVLDMDCVHMLSPEVTPTLFEKIQKIENGNFHTILSLLSPVF